MPKRPALWGMPSRTSSADVSSREPLTLPPQVSPPEFALSTALPHAVLGVEVAAVPVLPAEAEGDFVVLGPGGAELGERLGLDLLGVLEAVTATGKAGEVTCVPIPLG